LIYKFLVIFFWSHFLAFLLEVDLIVIRLASADVECHQLQYHIRKLLVWVPRLPFPFDSLLKRRHIWSEYVDFL
jgi:hypothetical protein